MKLKSIIICCLLFLLFTVPLQTIAVIPDIGVEIWIEPGNTKAQIDQWVKIAADQKMRVVRIFAMWTQIESEKDVWNFDIYDWMFESAEKYGIKLQVTLNANQPPAHYGEEFWSKTHSQMIFSDEKLLPAAAKFIALTVNRYKKSPALENWWLMNEPYGFNDFNEFAFKGFSEKMKQKYINIKTLNQKWMTDFLSFEEMKPIRPMQGGGGWTIAQPYYDWSDYCAEHLTQWQKWVHDEVMKYDTNHSFHTNPAGVFEGFQQQQTTQWKKFINSLGCSIHASWHFSALSRAQYAMGVAIMCEITKGNASPNPFWISELQGGNNTFSGNVPMCPTYNDIAQWTWTGIAEGAEKVIYWCLNSRLKGGEAGEWSMLNFQNKPSERLLSATSVIECMQRQKQFFEGAKPIESNITILLSPESNRMFARKSNQLMGTNNMAHITSAMACYEALAECGILAAFMQTQDFDWEGARGKVAIIPNALCIPMSLYPHITIFVANGNKLIMTGMSGHFDEEENNVFQLGSPLKEVLGAELVDLQLIANEFKINIKSSPGELPTHGWIGILQNNTAIPICSFGEYLTGVRNHYGKGEAVWIPCNIELGAWITGNKQLSEFLASETEAYTTKQPFYFANKTEDITMQTMYNNDNFVTVINNGTDEIREVKLINKFRKVPSVIYSTHSKKSLKKDLGISLSPRECLVVLWK